MAPVGSDGFLSREGEGTGGSDIQRLQRGLVAQALTSGRLLCVRGALVMDDSILRQWRRRRGKSMVLSSDIYGIKHIAPY